MQKVESSKPKKQRRYFYSKALHRKQKDLSGHLSKKLAERLGKRSLQVRKGDTVKIMRGSKKGSEGNVTGVDYRKGVVFIDKLVRKKADGTEIPMPVKASNLLIADVDRSDARRFKGKKPGKALEEEGEERKKEKEKIGPDKEVKKGKLEEKEEKKKIGEEREEKEGKKTKKEKTREKEGKEKEKIETEKR